MPELGNNTLSLQSFQMVVCFSDPPDGYFLPLLSEIFSFQFCADKRQNDQLLNTAAQNIIRGSTSAKALPACSACPERQHAMDTKGFRGSVG
jgi:hypothetical protein